MDKERMDELYEKCKELFKDLDSKELLDVFADIASKKLHLSKDHSSAIQQYISLEDQISNLEQKIYDLKQEKSESWRKDLPIAVRKARSHIYTGKIQHLSSKLLALKAKRIDITHPRGGQRELSDLSIEAFLPILEQLLFVYDWFTQYKKYNDYQEKQTENKYYLNLPKGERRYLERSSSRNCDWLLETHPNACQCALYYQDAHLPRHPDFNVIKERIQEEIKTESLISKTNFGRRAWA